MLPTRWDGLSLSGTAGVLLATNNAGPVGRNLDHGTIPLAILRRHII
jgi:hypothetical protein